jgi:hypothetical protein
LSCANAPGAAATAAAAAPVVSSVRLFESMSLSSLDVRHPCSSSRAAAS